MNALRSSLGLGTLWLSMACGGVVADPGNGRTPAGGAGESSSSSSSSSGDSPGNPPTDAPGALDEPPVFQTGDSAFVIRYVLLGGAVTPCAKDSVKSFRYDRATHQLSSDRCSRSSVQAERDAWPEVARTLDPEEAQSIEAILVSMRKQPAKSQGWDGWDIFLEVGTTKYSDRDINYMGNPHATRIRELYELVSSLPL